MSGAALDAALWARLSPLLDQALELTPDRRGGFVDRACGGDEGLRAHLGSLISSAEREDGPLEALPAGAAAAVLNDLEADLGAPGVRKAGRHPSMSAALDRTKPRSPRPTSPAREANPLSRFGRLVMQHRSTAAVALVIVTLAGFAVTATLTAARARRAAAAADLELTRSRREAAFLRTVLTAGRVGRSERPVSDTSGEPAGPSMREALDDAARALRKDPGDDRILTARLHALLGEAYLGLQALEAAESHLRAALSLSKPLDEGGPDLARVHSLLASALERLGRPEEANRARAR